MTPTGYPTTPEEAEQFWDAIYKNRKEGNLNHWHPVVCAFPVFFRDSDRTRQCLRFAHKGPSRLYCPVHARIVEWLA